jgi:phosphatidylglycerophosphate synthase
MIDAAVLPVLRRLLEGPAQALVARRVGADAITIAGFGLGMAALPALWAGWFWLALVLIVLNRLCDGLDGAVARLSGATDRGAFLDIVLDFQFYAAIPLGFALADPQANALPAAILIAAFMGTGSSFLAFAVMAERRGLKATAYPTKGIYYLGGLTEGAETIAFFLAMCLWPAAFPWLAGLFAALCVLTTGTRVLWGWTAFGGPR